ncbi:hypothetical protein CKO28_17550 [Rhodovibrio sodomensis]|uniref:Uncharacterized protein n=1 Tax=Rhodovibrio sodomensis TaxID=1088 RepID=A0ABS1DJ84_9PROT|nr:hypothetical protein [Rhodovibrio sodomensis]MBK1669844.1 hypothetical protein [Rhodovibrio sodomensis]
MEHEIRPFLQLCPTEPEAPDWQFSVTANSDGSAACHARFTGRISIDGPNPVARAKLILVDFKISLKAKGPGCVDVDKVEVVGFRQPPGAEYRSGPGRPLDPHSDFEDIGGWPEGMTDFIESHIDTYASRWIHFHDDCPETLRLMAKVASVATD